MPSPTEPAPFVRADLRIAFTVISTNASFTAISIFILGLVVGSFLNVVILRLETGEGIVKKRSHCVHCGHALRWYDLVPVLSYVFLRSP